MAFYGVALWQPSVIYGIVNSFGFPSRALYCTISLRFRRVAPAILNNKRRKQKSHFLVSALNLCVSASAV